MLKHIMKALTNAFVPMPFINYIKLEIAKENIHDRNQQLFYLLALDFTCLVSRQTRMLSPEHKRRDFWNVMFSNAFAGPKKP